MNGNRAIRNHPLCLGLTTLFVQIADTHFRWKFTSIFMFAVNIVNLFEHRAAAIAELLFCETLAWFLRSVSSYTIYRLNTIRKNLMYTFFSLQDSVFVLN